MSLIDPRISILEQELSRVRLEFSAAFDAVDAGAWHRAPKGQWTPAQILWHVAKVERGVARLIERQLGSLEPMATVPPGPAPRDLLGLLDEFPFLDRSQKARAPEGLRPPDEVDVIAERGRWVDGRVQLLVAMQAAGPKLSLVRYDHPLFGPFDGWQWVLMVARHEQRHLLQLREVLGQA